MNNPSTGVDEQADTTITITIEEVRSINKKLLERKYLINIVNEQDSIIKYQDDYIKEEQRIARELQDKIESSKIINEGLKSDINKIKVISGCLGVTLAISIIGLILK